MSKIDFSRTTTTEARAQAAAAARAAIVKAECSARITAVLDVHTLSNIQSAALTGDLSEAQMEVFRAARRWLVATQEACRGAIKKGGLPDWPKLPNAVAGLAKDF